jgi:hypothetical protein
MKINLLSIRRKSKILRFFLCFITILLLGIGTFRIFSFIFHDPLLAYANNYDMIRIQSCHQIWPLDPNIAPGDQTSSAPLKYYKFDKDIRLGGCQPSSELIFTSISAVIIKIFGLEHGFSVQIFGAVRGLLLSISSIGFSLWFFIKRKIITSLSNSLIYAIVLADPANTLYLNTFYSEFSALFFLYLSLLLLYSTCLYRKSLLLPFLFSSSLLLLSLSKYQHLALPIGILFSLLMINWRNLASIKYIAIGASVGAITGLSYQAYVLIQQDNMHLIKFANATNTFIGAVLPSASDPYNATQVLGLPKRCADYSGKTWYSPGFAKDHPCPEVINASRFKILLLAIKDPLFLVNITDEGIQLLQPWIVNYLGQISNQNLGQLTQFFTLSSCLNKLPILFLRIAFLIPSLIYLLACTNFTKKISTRTNNLMTLITAIISLMYIIFFSALFGDGYIEFQKHTHLFFSLYIALLIIVLIPLIWITISRFIYFYFNIAPLHLENENKRAEIFHLK